MSLALPTRSLRRHRLPRVAETLILVDYENTQLVDMSRVAENCRAIIYLGAAQSAPKAARNPASAHRFARVEFVKVLGPGGNALDFHIAYELGRVLQAAPTTSCVVLSHDTGFDPLLARLRAQGFDCSRVDSLDALAGAPAPGAVSMQDAAAIAGLAPCRHCRKAECVELHGGSWCANCARFSSPPDPKLLPSATGLGAGRALSSWSSDTRGIFSRVPALPECEWCHRRCDMSGGIFDEGEWMCGDCVGSFASD